MLTHVAELGAANRLTGMKTIASQRAGKLLRRQLGSPGADLLRACAELAARECRVAVPAARLVERVDEALLALGQCTSTPVLPPPLRNRAHAVRRQVAPLLRRLQRYPADQEARQRVVALLRGLLARAAAATETPVALSRDHSRFEKLAPRQVHARRLALESPDEFVRLQRRNELYAVADREIEAAIRAEGLLPGRTRLLGRVVHLGRDPATSEQVVFDLDGERLTIEEYVAKRKAHLATQMALSGHALRTEVPLDQLRRVSEAALAEATDVESVALTDDLARAGRLTRIYPVGWLGEQRVVTDGRFRGVYFDDLVNAAGRLLEGTSYTYSPATARSAAMPRRYDPSEREPYVTLTEVRERGARQERLFVQLPHFQGRFTEFRRALRRLSEQVPTVTYLRHSRNACFYFAAKDFAAVRQALGSLSLSAAALRHVQGYFADLARVERSVAAADLAHYTPGAIGGFRRRVGDRPLCLFTKQRQALAWLEANDYRGVCALDTGMGKTVIAIAAMQKLLRDGAAAAPSTNGRFLFVCPPALRGNLDKEITRFLTPTAAAALRARVDVLSYGELRVAARTGKWRGASFRGSAYVAAFFDEAQALKNPGSACSRAAQALGAPRTICLTASPLEHEPKEAYVLAAVASGLDLWHPDCGKARRREMMKFLRRYSQRVGGRTVGVHPDPLRRRELYTWVKRHLFYADKTDVAEHPLPRLSRQTVAIEMPTKVAREYRATARRFAGVMRGMVALLRDRGMLIDGRDEQGKLRLRVNPLARDPRIAQVFGQRFAPLVARLNRLANLPETLVPGAGYPKLEQAAKLVWRRLRRSRGQSRTLLFADDRQLVVEAARQLSARVPARVHAACLSDGIHLFKNGEALREWRGFVLPFGRRAYRPDMNRPVDPATNPEVEAGRWQTFVLRELLAVDPAVATVSLQGQIYNQGQNLQAFDTVIHLDRDSWNAEDMKQRTARAWRFGQQNPVQEYTLDVTYRARRTAVARRERLVGVVEAHEPRYGSLERTLDEVRRYHQILEGELFDQTIKEAQRLVLGAEWYGMSRQHASFRKVDRQTLALMASPYVTGSRPTRWRRHAA